MRTLLPRLLVTDHQDNFVVIYHGVYITPLPEIRISLTSVESLFLLGFVQELCQASDAGV